RRRTLQASVPRRDDPHPQEVRPGRRLVLEDQSRPLVAADRAPHVAAGFLDPRPSNPSRDLRPPAEQSPHLVLDEAKAPPGALRLELPLTNPEIKGRAADPQFLLRLVAAQQPHR